MRRTFECGYCGAVRTQNHTGGRRAEYCDDRCRSGAARRRRGVKPKPRPPAAPRPTVEPVELPEESALEAARAVAQSMSGRVERWEFAFSGDGIRGRPSRTRQYRTVTIISGA